MVRLIQTDPHHPAARSILGEPSAGEASDLVPPRGVLLLLVEDGETIAGGALAPLEDGIAQVKRLWTGPAHRDQGYSRHMLAALELEAAVLGYRAIRVGPHFEKQLA
jgi:GNAT superfamily N-acetyltransferase